MSEVSELKLNDINNQMTSIHTALNNITSSHKAQNDWPKISSNQDTDEIKFLQVNLGNNDIKKDQHKHKSKTKKRNEKCRSVKVVVGDSIVKKVKGWELSTKDDLFTVRSFPGAKTDDMESYILNPRLQKTRTYHNSLRN